MSKLHSLFALLVLAGLAGGWDLPPVSKGLTSPAAVAVTREGKVFVAARDAKDGAGVILVIEKERIVPFATGLEDPRALASHGQWLFAAERKRILRIDRGGNVEVFVDAKEFPSEPRSLVVLVVDPQGGPNGGTVYVCDAGDHTGNGGAVYRITQGKKVNVVLDQKNLPSLHTPSGLVLDGAGFLLLLDGGSGELQRIKVADGSTEKVAQGLAGCGGLAWDPFGRLFIGDPKRNRLLIIARPGEEPVAMVNNLAVTAGFCIGPTGSQVLVPNPRTGSLAAVPVVIPGGEVDVRPLAVETAVAFPDLQWSGWKGETDDGRLDPLRPVLLTHAGDGTNRVFVATEQGIVHTFPNDQKAAKTTVFLDIRDRVRFNEKNADAGFLGLAFHPQFKKNGEFFAFYTAKNAVTTNILSRFKVSKSDPDRADPASEEELMRFTKAEIYHNGGTLCFGPDGYLYIATGDGGPQGDPRDNGQNLGSLLAKVLRVDVDKREDGKTYGIPHDNPFVGRAGARPEVWAYGLRVIWRMAFDRATGLLWAADVGQDRFEEINIIKRGGNYGWNRREGLHPFGAKGKGPGKEFIDPIWEYHHDLGACVIGGAVYRGRRVAELQGYYVYADYTSSRLWALRYDPAKGRVVENRALKDRGHPIWSFGEDEQGEVYLLSRSVDGRGIFRFAKARGRE
jgi:glucose/arabinose dehydrogenase